MTPSNLSILVAVEPLDMRRSFDGLAAAVRERLGKDARTERTIFVFINRRNDMLKLLWRDTTGWCVLAKRLDERVVVLPRDIPEGAKSVVVDPRTLAVLLDGVVRRRRETSKSIAHEASAAVARARLSTRE